VKKEELGKMPSSKRPRDKEGGESECLKGKKRRVENWGVGRMPSAERLGEKEGGECEHGKHPFFFLI